MYTRLPITLTSPAALILFIFALSACSTTKFNGKVVSCADQKPVDAASLKFHSMDKLNNNMAGTMPSSTKADGTFEADVALAQGAQVNLMIEKDGFQPKEQPLTSGSEQLICLDPKK